MSHEALSPATVVSQLCSCMLTCVCACAFAARACGCQLYLSVSFFESSVTAFLNIESGNLEASLASFGTLFGTRL